MQNSIGENQKSDELAKNITFSFEQQEIYEIGAALAVILASPPEVDDGDVRARFHTVLCSEGLRSRYEWDGEWASSPQMIKPIYAFHPLNAVQRDMNTINRRISDRLQAAHIAICYLKEAEEGKIPEELSGHIERVSLNEMIRVFGETNRINIDNFETRIWRPSLPVIHLAVALAINMSQAKQDKKRTSLGDIIFNKGIITSIIGSAETYEESITATKMLIDMNKMVKIRLA